MSSIECAFMGVLGRDAEAKTSKAGRSICGFLVASAMVTARNGCR